MGKIRYEYERSLSKKGFSKQVRSFLLLIQVWEIVCYKRIFSPNSQEEVSKNWVKKTREEESEHI